MIKEKDEGQDISTQQKVWDVAWAINHRGAGGTLRLIHKSAQGSKMLCMGLAGRGKGLGREAHDMPYT